MEKLNCHGGTKKEEILEFVKANQGRKIEIHYENNIYDTWGDYDLWTYDTSKESELEELNETIKDHYIHGIKCVE